MGRATVAEGFFFRLEFWLEVYQSNQYFFRFVLYNNLNVIVGGMINKYAGDINIGIEEGYSKPTTWYGLIEKLGEALADEI